jgi:competence protein ComEA
MHYVAGLVGRKMLVGAFGAVALGVVLLVRAFGGPLTQAEGPEPLAADPLLLESPGMLDTLDPEGFGEPEPTAPPVVVYVSGAVVVPDVYQLPAAARVKDLVLAAGGLSADADADRINLAARIADGEHVYVPRLGEESSAAPQSAASAGGAGGLVDINAAGAAELDSLPGIGPALAERIITHREENGPFESVEDLRQVKGIGAALFSQIAPLVTAGA